jgi:hypothetical protein
MEIVSILYAALFLALAGAASACCSSVSKLRKHSLQVFLAILAFGVCSYMGSILIIVFVGSSPLGWLFDGRLSVITWTLAYLLPGLAGGWCAVKCVESMRKWGQRKTEENL